MLSATNAAESPTALLARREMQSWRLLQLEPSSLRKPDEFTAPTRLGVDGSHLAATLYHLARTNNHRNINGAPHDAAAAQIVRLHSGGRDSDTEKSHENSVKTYGQVANRWAELIDDVYEIGSDRDERRELLTLLVTDQDLTSHPARVLSDGTLRLAAKHGAYNVRIFGSVARGEDDENSDVDSRGILQTEFLTRFHLYGMLLQERPPSHQTVSDWLTGTIPFGALSVSFPISSPDRHF